MKMISSLILLLGTVLSASALSNFSARLVATEPENSWIPASAAFSLDGTSASFTITFGYEGIVPTTARLSGTNAEFSFELGPPFIVIHSPGPWPDGYDGSTTFVGFFSLPDNLREEFVAGRTTLLLLGSEAGDFRGAVLPASRPLVEGLDRQGSILRFHFTAEPPYRYAVEYTESVGSTNWLPLTNYLAKVRTVEAVVTDSVTNASARFYRIRQDHCECR